uniref:Uncharacterized protein n=1 Tax=Ficedula albicollis TaxID=59894 RepID=A0A803V1H5_FICAL
MLGSSLRALALCRFGLSFSNEVCLLLLSGNIFHYVGLGWELLLGLHMELPLGLNMELPLDWHMELTLGLNMELPLDWHTELPLGLNMELPLDWHMELEVPSRCLGTWR